MRPQSKGRAAASCAAGVPYCDFLVVCVIVSSFCLTRLCAIARYESVATLAVFAAAGAVRANPTHERIRLLASTLALLGR